MRKLKCLDQRSCLERTLGKTFDVVLSVIVNRDPESSYLSKQTNKRHEMDETGMSGLAVEHGNRLRKYI